MITAFTVMLCFIANAQDNRPSAREIADYTTTLMEKDLSLVENQIATVDSLNFAFAKAQLKLIDQPGGMYSKIGDMKSMNKEKIKELSKVLTEDQLEEYEDEVMPKLKKYFRKKLM